MNFKLVDGVFVEICRESQLPYFPRLELQGMSVMVSHYSSPSDHEQFIAATTGSVDWNSFTPIDELRFGSSRGDLVGVWFHVPEYAIASEESARGWLATQVLRGSIVCSSVSNFIVGSTDVRWVSPEGSLLCLRSVSNPCPDERVRLQVAENFCLLFGAGELIGWELLEAEHSLVFPWASPSRAPSDSMLSRLLSEYLNIVQFPLIDKIIEGDPGIRESLESLYARISLDRGAVDRRNILRVQIRNLIDNWY